MKIRGFIDASSGSGSMTEDKKWLLSIGLQVWREPGKPIRVGSALIWRLCKDEKAFEKARDEVPAAGTLVEFSVDAPDPIPGLEFRERGPNEFAFKKLVGTVIDPELTAAFQSSRAPASIKTRLGTFKWDDRVKWFAGKREFEKYKYSLNVEVANKQAPKAELEAVAPVVARFERGLTKLKHQVAKPMRELWLDGWQNEGEAKLTIAQFAERMRLNAINVSEGRIYLVYFGDDGLFLGHSIEVFLKPDGSVEADIVG